MNYRLVISSEAEQDLQEVTKWYESQKESLGERLLDLIGHKLQSIASNPLKYQVRYRETRMSFVQPFPVAIHFLVRDNLIYVVAFMSTHRDFKK